MSRIKNYVDYRGKTVDGKPHISSSSYHEDISRGLVPGIIPWIHVGFSPTVNTTLSDVWSKAGVYAFPAAAAQWEIDSSSANDVGTVIAGNAEGAAQSVLADTGSTTTTLYDASVDFTGGTAVAVGDCILLDPKGENPEWGYVTDITDAATGTLVVGNGFSKGGNPAGRAYTIVDYSGATGAQVVKIEYLDANYGQHTILACLNGTTAVPLDGVGGAANTGTFRVNSFRIIATGSGLVAAGNVFIADVATHAINYSYILAGYTRARSSIFTVPAHKTLYVNQLVLGYGTTGGANKEYCRIFAKGNVDWTTGFRTGNIFYTCLELLESQGTSVVNFDLPTIISAKTDIKISALASAAGVATVYMKGWIE